MPDNIDPLEPNPDNIQQPQNPYIPEIPMPPAAPENPQYQSQYPDPYSQKPKKRKYAQESGIGTARLIMSGGKYV